VNREIPHIDYDLIAKCLTGEGSEADRQALEHWLGSSEENRLEYENLKRLWDASSEETVPAVDMDTAWNEVSAQALEDTPVIRIDTVEGPGRRWLSWAAMIALALAVGAGIWYTNRGTAPEMLTLISGDAATELQLADGSRITLRENSTLVYPQAFNGHHREVTLTGVGYFSIAADKEHPFIVHTEAGDIRVVGTEFEIDARTPDQQLVVEVAEGVVEVAGHSDHLTSRVQAGKVCTLSVADKSIDVQEITDPSAFFWKDHTIRFRRTELGRVAKTLEELLHIRVKFDNEALTGCELTATFRDEDATTIMEIIATTLGLQVNKEGDTFILSGEGC